MSRYKAFISVALSAVLIASSCRSAESVDDVFTYPANFDIGDPIDASEKDALHTTIPPDGQGLPPGQGTFDEGSQIYAAKCASCHGSDLKGTLAGMPLIGGRDSLTSESPKKTVESFWPYATSVYSYIRNTMPVQQPGSLSDEEVYSLMAFILGSAEIVPVDIVMNRQALTATRMPNRDGFVRDDRPDVEMPVDLD